MNEKLPLHRRRWPWLAGVGALAGIGLLVWALRPAALAVETAAADRGPVTLVIEEEGVLRLLQRHTVAAPTSGELQRPGLRVGDTVAAGEALAVLRPVAPAMIDSRTRTVLQQRLGSAQAAQAAAEAQQARQQAALAQAEADVRRQTELARAQFVAPAAREQAELARRLAAQAVAAADAERRVAAFGLAEARAALARADTPASDDGLWTLRSPVDGRVVAVHRESAGPVSAGQPLMDIGDTTRLEAVIDLLSSDAARVPRGALVTLSAGPGVPPLSGRVALVEPVAFTRVSALGIEEQRVKVHVALADALPAGGALGDGYRVDARVVVQAIDGALRVPVAALQRQGEGWAVFVVDDGGQARLRAVALGPRSQDHAVVERGLADGERVVLFPGNGVRDGARVRQR